MVSTNFSKATQVSTNFQAGISQRIIRILQSSTLGISDRRITQAGDIRIIETGSTAPSLNFSKLSTNSTNYTIPT